MQHLFFSHAHFDNPLDAEIIAGLRQRGLRVWHDTDQFGAGDHMPETAEQALDTLPGAAFLLTETAITRPFIREIELRQTGRRLQRDGSFRPAFILCNLDRDAATEVVRRYADIHLPTLFHETISLSPEMSVSARQAAINTLCDRLARPFLNDALKRVQAQQPCRVGLHTYADDEPNSADVFSFDWRTSFRTGVPTAHDWLTALQPALDRAATLFRQHDLRAVELHCAGHLSAAVALGHAFRPGRGFRITAVQRDQHWPVDDRHDPDPALVSTPIRGGAPIDATAWSLEVSISRDVTPAVNHLLRDGLLQVRTRRRLEPANGHSRTYVRDAQHANEVGAAVARTIADMRREHPGITTHLFLAAPPAVAVSIGAQLNKCGPIQVYEYVAALDSYCPSCRLGT